MNVKGSLTLMKTDENLVLGLCNLPDVVFYIFTSSVLLCVYMWHESAKYDRLPLSFSSLFQQFLFFLLWPLTSNLLVELFSFLFFFLFPSFIYGDDLTPHQQGEGSISICFNRWIHHTHARGHNAKKKTPGLWCERWRRGHGLFFFFGWT